MGESRFLFPFFFAGYKSRCDWHANFCPSLDAFGCVPRTCRDSWPKIGALFGNKGEGEGVRRMVRQKDAEPDAFRDRFASWLVPCVLLVFALCRFSPAGWMKGRQGIREGCCVREWSVSSSTSFSFSRLLGERRERKNNRSWTKLFSFDLELVGRFIVSSKVWEEEKEVCKHLKWFKWSRKISA